jgi:Actinobacteria/chloroflexi VLRF1 release factor
MEQTRWVEVDPERFSGWVARFGERHGGQPTIRVSSGSLVLDAPDGERAECHPPPGIRLKAAAPAPLTPGAADDQAASSVPPEVAALVAAAARPRRLGILLVRKGGFAVGIALGKDLVTSKVDSRYVQSRTAAGGWSQHRFARRRDNQAKASAGEAADLCVRLLLPEARRIVALVTGGDRHSVDAVLADPRLAGLGPLVAERFLVVPDPKLAVLQVAVVAARTVRIRIVPAETV